MAEWAATFRAKFIECLPGGGDTYNDELANIYNDENGKAYKTGLSETWHVCFGDVYYVDPHPIPDPYEGPYVVVPKTVDQILATNDKTMTDDVTVKEIPYAEVGNTYGTTVTIAS